MLNWFSGWCNHSSGFPDFLQNDAQQRKHTGCLYKWLFVYLCVFHMRKSQLTAQRSVQNMKKKVVLLLLFYYLWLLRNLHNLGLCCAVRSNAVLLASTLADHKVDLGLEFV